MSARINGITNTNNDVVIENNMKELPLVREEYYLTRESFNKFIANDISFGSNISISGDLIPLNSVTSELGSSTKYWSNAYIRDVSVSNMSISGNINVSENINITENINISGNINVSENINISGNLLSLSNTSQIGSSENYWSNAYIRDVSINNISISGNNSVGGNISISGNNSVGGNISISGDIIPLNNAISDLGSNEKYWRNAYMRDLSVTNISVSGSITIPNGSILTNDISNLNITHEKIANNAIQTHNIDNSAITHAKIANNAIQAHNIANNAITHVKIADNAIQVHNIDASAVINSKIAYGTITSDKINSSGTWSFTNISISGDLIPLNSVASDLGSSTNYWSNAYIHDISASNISVSGNINVDKNISISGDLEPLYSVRSDLGSSTKYWRNAYIDNIDISSHIRIGNGHFGGKITTTTTPHELIIDPYSFEDSPYTGNDASGRVVILGDLIVRGDTTTITSNIVDISDLLLNIASSATKNTVFGIESGITLGSDSYASLLYNKDSNSWRTNIGIEISGNITLSGNLISSSNTSLLGSSANYWNDAYITNLNVTNFVNTIDASYLTNNTITSAKIANGTIVDTDISNNASIAFSKINASLAIADSDISSNAAINGSKLADASIASSKIDSTGTWTFTNISGTHMTISGNLIPLTANNSSTLGSTTNYWRNAYIQDLSVNNTMSISGNLEPLNSVNSSRLGNIGKLWSNAYITNISATNITISGTITIPTGSITSSHIADGTIMNLDISSNADISGSKIANASIASSKIDSTGTWTFTNISGTHMSISGNLVPLYVTNTSTLGSTTNYWRNAYITDLSVNNTMSISGNLEPLASNNTSKLGSTSKLWSNAYIRDLSVANITVSGTITIPTGSIISSHIADGTIMNLDISSNADISGSKIANASIASSKIDSTGTWTFTNISGTHMSISGNLVPLYVTNTSTLGSTTNYWRNAYIANIDVSGDISNVTRIIPQLRNDISSSLGTIQNTWQKAFISDLSGITKINGTSWPLNSGSSDFSGTDISTSLIPRNPTSIDLGSIAKYWRNAYIRDLSVTNIEISGNLLPLRDISSDLGSSLKRWRNIYVNDLSVSRINGQVYSAGGTAIDLTSVSGNIIPSLNNNFRLGDVSRNWSNAYITNISATNISVSGNIIFSISGGSIRIAADASTNSITTTSRIYQNISGGINDLSWTSVNGYYGLTKDAYPSLNPSSSGVKAVEKWISRVSQIATWWSVCWSPELQKFAAVGNSGSMTSSDGITWYSSSQGEGIFVCWSPGLRIFVSVNQSFIATSPDGITWTQRSNINNYWVGVCWSPELGLLVAVARDGTNKVATSPDGITWSEKTSAGESNGWRSVCWSPELRIFVAVATAGNNRVMTSPDGTSWTARLSALETASWFSVCWSPQLGLFVVVSSSGSRVMTSPDGINWTIRSIPSNAWRSVCWSPELKLFVAVAEGGTNRVMTSPDGTSWTARLSALETALWSGVCWSPELGLFVAVAWSGVPFRVMTSSLKGRPPTSYNVFDSSFNAIDESGNWTFSNISISGNIIPVNNNRSDLGLSNTRWKNLYINNIDVSGDISNVTRIIPQLRNDISSSLGTIQNTWQKAFISDLSGITKINGTSWPLNSGSSDFSGTDISTSLIPRNPTSIDLGSIAKYWRNAYIRDISVANITVSGTITIPTGSIISSHIADGTIMNLDISSNADISGSKIANASIASSKIDSTGTWTFTNISGTHMSISGNLVPLYVTNTSTLGSTTNYWRNAYITDLSVNNTMSISGNLEPLASNNTSKLGSTSKLWSNAYIRDLSVANITVSGNMLSQNNTSQVPVSYSTFSVVSAPNRTLPPYIGISANEWIPAYAYDISKVVLSNRSVIKIEVKVNYTASPEADQTLSFRVRESSNNGLSYIPTPVFSDISLGSSMGVTINNIYNGSYYDDLSGITLSGNIITYRLEFRRDCPSGNTIKTDYGIQASTGNYISLQELYKPP